MTCLFDQIDEQGGISTLYINRMLEPTVRAEVGATYLSEPVEPKVRHPSLRQRAYVVRMVEDEKEKRLCKLTRVYLQQTSNPLHKHPHVYCQNCISDSSIFSFIITSSIISLPLVRRQQARLSSRTTLRILLLCLRPTSSSTKTRFFSLPTTFISIFLFLRP